MVAAAVVDSTEDVVAFRRLLRLLILLSMVLEDEFFRFDDDFDLDKHRLSMFRLKHITSCGCDEHR